MGVILVRIHMGGISHIIEHKKAGQSFNDARVFKVCHNHILYEELTTLLMASEGYVVRFTANVDQMMYDYIEEFHPLINSYEIKDVGGESMIHFTSLENPLI